MKCSFTAILTLLALCQIQAQTVTITLTPGDTLFNTAAQAISGVVVPADALLSLAGQPITLDVDGNFTHTVTLHAGLNTFLFKATHANYDDGVAKTDLYLDTTPPTLSFTSPENGVHVNGDAISIYGRLSDDYDPAPLLTREGNPITLDGGRFSELELALDISADATTTQFTYTATDAAGNSQDYPFTVVRNIVPPNIVLTTPAVVVHDGSYTLNLSVTDPLEIVSLSLAVDGTLAHQADNGDPFSGNFSHAGSSRSIPVVAVARDSFGNESRETATITVAHDHYLFGQVLTDGDSLPASGITLTVMTPAASYPLTTDSQGRYETYLQGLPATVTVTDGNYLPMSRTFTQFTAGWRVPDLRLTPRNPSGALGSHPLGDFNLTLSGFTGNAQVTAISDQALPVMLPLGYSPVIGFEIEGAGGTGTLLVNADRLPLLAAAEPVYVLRQNGDGWDVIDTATSGAATLSLSFSSPAGRFLAALRDPWLSGDPPPVGSHLVRTEDSLVDAASLTAATTYPTSISLVETPQTDFFMRVKGGVHLPSGSRARVRCSEAHRRAEETLTVPDYLLDITCYNYRVAAQDKATLIGGKLAVHSREEVSADLTRYASIRFTSEKGDHFSPTFPENNTWTVGNLTLDFNGAAATTPVITANPLLDDSPPLGPHAETVSAFEIWVGGPLTQSIQLSLSEENHQNLVLLRRLDSGNWAYAGRLSYSNGIWQNEVSQSEIDRSGAYALVALDYPITELRGTISDGLSPVAGAVISGQSLPWLGMSDSNGVYRYLAVQLSQDSTTLAYDPVTRKSGEHTLGDTTGVDLLTNQDISLQDPEFQMVQHNPAADAWFISRSPQITLVFNMPLTRDSANLETNISLSNGGTTTPLRILVEEDRVTTSILPLDILSPDTLYTLSLSTGLETLYGNTLSAPQSFTFRTKAVAQAGELDLTRFYLEWDGGDLYVKAPAQAYPDRTYLEITNEEGGDTWSGTLLTSSDFSQIIGGEPGQSVELSAVTPNGARLEHRLETVVLAGDKILLGSTAFAHALSEELAFRGDDPGEGFGRELELRTVDGTVIDGDIAAVATLGNTTTFQALYGMELSVADGTGLPGMNGRIEFDFDVVNAPDSLVHLIALIPGIMAPDDPEDPATLTSHTIAQHLDSLRVESNQLVGKYQSRGKRNLSGKQSLSYNLNDVAHLDVTKVRLAVVQQPFSAAKRGALGPGLGWLNKATLYAVRKLPTGELAPALKPIFETPYQPSQWQIPWLAQHRPAPLSFFYKITAGPTPIPTFLGVADATGKASLFTDADLLDVRAVDPITSEYIGIGYASENGENAITEGIAVGRGFAIFDPESNLISKGEALPPSLGIQPSVSRDSGNGKVKDSQASRELTQLHRVRYDDEAFIKVLVTSSQPLAHFQSGVDGAPVQEFEELNEKSWVFYVPVLGATEELISVWFQGTNAHGDSAEVRYDILIYQENGPTSKPGPPEVLAIIPRDGADNIPLNPDPFEVVFTEPVNITASGFTLSVSGQGSPKKMEVFDALGEPIEGMAWQVYLQPAEALHPGKTYQIQIKDLTDGIDTLVPFTSSFTTSELKDRDNITDGKHISQPAHLGNLTLFVQDGREGILELYDVRYPRAAMDRLWQKRIPVIRGFNHQIALFTQEDLASSGNETAIQDDDPALNELPDGTILAVAFKSKLVDLNRLKLFEYHRGVFTERASLPVLDPGRPRAIARWGRFLALGTYDAIQLLNGVTSRGKVTLYDVNRLLVDYDDYLDRPQGVSIADERDFFNLGVVEKITVTEDPMDLEFFNRTTSVNGGSTLPALSVSSVLRYGYFHVLDPQYLPPVLGVRKIPGNGTFAQSADPLYDGREVSYPPAWPGADNITKKNTGAVERFTWNDPVAGQTQKDVAVFSHEHADTGYLLAQTLEPSAGPREVAAGPLYTLVFPSDGPGIRHMAVSYNGIIAIVDHQGRLSLLDLRTWLESGAGTSSVDNHPAFISKNVFVGPINWMTFNQGNLYMGRRGKLQRYPIAAKIRREYGWMYMAPRVTGDTKTPLTPEKKLAKHMLFRAGELEVGENLEPVAEVGTFEYQVFETGKFKIKIEALDGPNIVQVASYSRTVATTGVHAFAMVDVPRFLLTQAKDAFSEDFLERGFARFRLALEFTGDIDEKSRFVSDFAYVYKAPKSRALDPNRVLPLYAQVGFDLLERHPLTGRVDLAYSAGHPMVDLSVAHGYQADFDLGPYGMHFSPNLPRLGQAAWWHLKDWNPSAKPTVGQVSSRLLFSHMGAVEASFDPQFKKGPALDHLQAEFDEQKTHTSIQIGHQVDYRFAAGSTSQYPLLFNNLNQGLSQAREYRLPVFRTYQTSRFLPSMMSTPRDVQWRRMAVQDEIIRDGNTLTNTVSGESRSVKLIPSAGLFGRVSTNGQTPLVYFYEGQYLSRVEMDGKTVARYTWKELFRLGSWPIKVLASVEELDPYEGDHGSALARKYDFNYNEGTSARVSTITTPLGDKAVTADANATWPYPTTVQGIAPAVDTTFTFATVADRHLVSSINRGEPVTYTWIEKTSGNTKQPLLSAVAAGGADLFKWDYDSDGRLLNEYRYDMDQAFRKFSYQPEIEAWFNAPTLISSNTSGANYDDIKMEHNDGATEVTSGSLSQTLNRVNGVSSGFKDLLGRERKIDSFAFHGPKVGLYDQDEFGLPTQAPLLLSDKKVGTEITRDIFQNVTTSTNAGIETTFGYNQWGPAQTTTLGEVITWTHTKSETLYSVEQSSSKWPDLKRELQIREDGLVHTEKIKNKNTQEVQSSTYTYDAYLRLVQVTRSLTDGLVQEIPSKTGSLAQTTDVEYWGKTHLISKITTTDGGLASSVTYLRPENDGTIHNIQVDQNGQTATIQYQTDRQGRMIRGEMPDIGVVHLSYNPFGLPVKISDTPANDPEPEPEPDPDPDPDPNPNPEPVTKRGSPNEITFVYGEGAVFIDNGFKGTLTKIEGDLIGKKSTVSIAGLYGNGTTTQTVNTTVQDNVLGQGLNFVVKSDMGDQLPVTRIFDSLGNIMSTSLGSYQTSTALDDQGYPISTSIGNKTATVQRDGMGRIYQIQGFSGLTQSWTQDMAGRITSVKGVLGPQDETTFDYIGQTGMINTASKNGVVLVDRAGTPLTAVTQTERGASRTIAAPDLDTTRTITRTENDVEATATMVVDPIKSQPVSFTDFLGAETSFSFADSGKSVQITYPDTDQWIYTSNAAGELETVSHDGKLMLSVKRDPKTGRIAKVKDDETGITLSYTYNGPDLTSITGGPRNVYYDNFNDLGQPKEILFATGTASDDQTATKLVVSYHDNGQPACVNISDRGGLTRTLSYDNRGLLTGIKRGFEPGLTFTQHDAFGHPTELTYDNQSFTLNQGQNRDSFTLPGDTTLQLDSEGRLQQIQRPGLSPKSFTYNANDQLAEVKLDDTTVGTYVYDYGQQKSGKLTQFTAGPANAKTVDVAYGQGDEHITGLEIVGEKAVSFTYDAQFTDQVKNYTDPNGVNATYTYDGRGRVSAIAITNGPSFSLTYDTSNRMTMISDGSLKAHYDNYQNGTPTTVDWYSGATKLEDFTVSHTAQGQLDQVKTENGEFLLDLDWENAPDTGFCDPGAVTSRISQVIRQGPGLKEIWIPTYQDRKLISLEIQRFFNGSSEADQIIHEDYSGPGLLRTIDNGTPILELTQTMDLDAAELRVGSTINSVSGTQQTLSYDALVGNLNQIATTTGQGQAKRLNDTANLTWDAFRQLTAYQDSQNQFSYSYDFEGRRTVKADDVLGTETVYFYHGSKVIAIGKREPSGAINWTHTIGHGPMGPVYYHSLASLAQSFFIFTDHLGTPFAYRNVATGQVTFTPFNPWGELLADSPNGPDWEGQVPTPANSFTLPLINNEIVPIGLGGHIYDERTGLVYMHHRYHHPRLYHFLTPDFRAPDIYDPTTFNEPYAYAAGNPVMFWDPDGLKELIFMIRSTNYGITIEDATWKALVEGMPIINGQPLFDYPISFTPEYTLNEGVGWDYANEEEWKAYNRAFSQRSKVLEQALIEGFQANARSNFESIRGDIAHHLGHLSQSDLYRLYGELNAIGVLPYLGADVVGNGHALEIAGFLVTHENQTYVQYGLFQDMDTAFFIEDIITLGATLVSKPVREIGKAGLKRLVKKGSRLATRGRIIRYPKVSINWQPGGVLADTMGNAHVVWPKFNLSFSMGAGGTSRRTLIHYTDETGLRGMLDSGEMWASHGPVHARHGDGQYFSDIFPSTIVGLKKADLTPEQIAAGQMSLSQLSAKFFRLPFNTHKLTHYIEIDVTNLKVLNPKAGIFLVPGGKPLDITGLIISSGRTVP